MLKMKLWAKRLWWKVEHRWPLMTKKQHESILDTRVRNERATVSAKANTAESEAKRMMLEVIPKLVRASADRSYSENRFRLVVDLDPYLLRDCFQWGNDQKAMEYFCEVVGHHVHRELRTMNMHRFQNELPRNPRMYSPSPYGFE